MKQFNKLVYKVIIRLVLFLVLLNVCFFYENDRKDDTLSIPVTIQKSNPYKNQYASAAMIGMQINKPLSRIPTRELIIITESVPDKTLLIKEIRRTQKKHQDLSVLVLKDTKSGVDEVSKVLRSYQNLDAVHLISHGASGKLFFGESYLDLDGLTENGDAIRRWGDALKRSGDFLIYGCRVAEGQMGKDFIRQLSNLLGVNVGGSIDLTGASTLSGDWHLEFQVKKYPAHTLFMVHSTPKWVHTLAAPIATDDPSRHYVDVLNYSPISYWRLGESSGTSTIDSGTAGNTATYYNGVSLGEPGALTTDEDDAVFFDGVNDYIEAPHISGYGTSQGTIQFWINISEAITGDYALFAKDEGSASILNSLAIVLTSDAKIMFYLEFYGTFYQLFTTNTISLNQWYHITASFGPDGMKLYLNSMLEASDSYTGGIGPNTEAISIGANTRIVDGAVVPAFPFKGYMDEVAFFGTQLSDATVKSLYSGGIQYYTINGEGGILTVTADWGFLINDSDTDGDTLTASIDLSDWPSHYSAFSWNSNGSFSYTHDGSANYSDTFIYTVNDGNGSSDTGTVYITILPSAAQAPTDITFAVIPGVTENSVGGTVIATMSTTDSNPSDSHTYEVIGTASTLFEASGNGIRVKSGADIDYETATSHTINVRTTDSSDKSYEESFVIAVNDLSTSITGGQSFSISESVSDSDSVGSVATTGDAATGFSLISGNTNSAFAISTSGVITVNAASAIDYETVNSYTLGVRATDGTSNADSTVTVSISDTSLSITGGQSFSISESVSDGDSVGSVATTGDAATGFSLISGNTNSAFAISSGGAITVNASSAIDYETVDSYTLGVRATDGTSNADSTVTVSIC